MCLVWHPNSVLPQREKAFKQMVTITIIFLLYLKLVYWQGIKKLMC